MPIRKNDKFIDKIGKHLLKNIIIRINIKYKRIREKNSNIIKIIERMREKNT